MHFVPAFFSGKGGCNGSIASIGLLFASRARLIPGQTRLFVPADSFDAISLKGIVYCSGKNGSEGIPDTHPG
jgi:hypothetical protein